MEGYIGTQIIRRSKTKYRSWHKVDFALLWIEEYGYIDGEHHKQNE